MHMLKFTGKEKHTKIDSELPTQVKVLPRVPTYIKIPCKRFEVPCHIMFEYPVAGENMVVFT